MSDRHERLELIERLRDNASVEAAIEEIKEQREKYYARLGQMLIQSKDPVNQREIDYKAGVWYGALWAYTKFLRDASTSLELEIENAAKERLGDS